MIFLLPFVFLGGWLNQAGSLVLTSSPMTATDGEVFTLTCSSNISGGQDRQWSRNGTLLFTTSQGPQSISVANNDVFNRYLSGRVSVSGDATQHNVTLRINSTIDNGSRWQCVANAITQWSNTLTINVTAHQTTLTTKTNAALVTTATDTDIASTGSTDVNVSKTSPFSTSTTTSTTTFTTTTNNNNNTHGRPISTSGPTTATTSNRSTGQSDTIAIAAGAAGGGVAVIAAVIVAAVCIRKRRRSVEDTVRDKSRRDRSPSRSAEMLIEGGVTGEDEKVMMDNIIYTSSSEVVPAEYSAQGHNQADKVMQDNILYTSASDIAPADYRTGDPNPFDVYTEVKKVKTNADEHEVTDMYAKPHKGRKQTSNGDMYAQVNKVKSREGTSETTCENNIEDMYTKPQKDKRNVKSNADTD
ncbi:serine-rich adhesin for platelets-like isoform X2 [Haliotis asinina]|uniref:serine-rich adhesin for platelets-like isoform X2 n=1 Tax=Haliotis asinina TaxID=109174 RepID=UPI00353218E3